MINVQQESRSRRSIALTAMFLAVVVAATGCAEVLQQLELAAARDVTTPDDGLREALRVGTDRAVALLSKTNGYLEDPQVRIPVPDELGSIEKALRRLGAERLVDDFVTSLNRAAEAAAPLARDVFVDAVRQMSFEDAVAILRGKEHEATDYLERTAGPRLRSLFLPIVSEKLDAVGATRRFGELNERAERLPFIDKPILDLEDYVTGRALDGLFGTIAREEEKIRRDPVARTTELLRKYFGEDARF